jgi:GNAT superfamily N-acetyltransferase
MKVEVTKESVSELPEYARVSIAFTVDRALDVAVQRHTPGGFALTERKLDPPYLKDYDALEGPAQWANRFDLSNWTLFVARADGVRVGGAAVASKTAGLTMLEGRDDLAVLWDLRVAPWARRQGVGSALFNAAEAWATAQSFHQLKVETQNINVDACRFYARIGCVLRAANRLAYPELPDEIQLLWFKDLSTAPAAGR